jgi:hypothetical protein
MKHRAVLGSVALALVAAVGCDGTTTSVGSLAGSGGASSSSSATSSSTGTGAGGGGDPQKVDKVDVLIAVDNSRSMADKQGYLAAAVADLLQSLVNPLCFDPAGNISSVQPGGPEEDCPEGTSRTYPAMNDIHVGVISSSLGGHGSDACGLASPGNATNDDKAHLLSRLDPMGGGSVSTYLNLGFLAWDPLGQKSPPGEADWASFSTAIQDVIVGVGQLGCGYESQLESIYRFLVDPAPYASISLVNSQIEVSGVDVTILEQRKAFLRPDSMLIVATLTDENDCSTQETGQFYLANQLMGPGGAPYHLPKARAACAADPNSACCRSCGLPAGVDEQGNACPEDPTCGTHDDASDPVNLRCFDQKRRFGIDFLYPTDRYVEALSAPQIADRSGALVPNPIFSDLDPADGVSPPRDPSLVVFAGIVGVPWQDVARDPNDAGSGLRSAAELTQDLGGFSAWDVVLGDPASYVAPLDPHMVESIAPRSGTNPITGTATAPPGSPADSDPINGSEYSLPNGDDLQYACIFDLPTPRDCAAMPESCDCMDPNNDSPLCASDPSSGGNTLQVRAKAYPGLRQLDVLRSLGQNAVVSSICPAQIDDTSLPSYGYRPVARAVLERVKPHL